MTVDSWPLLADDVRSFSLHFLKSETLQECCESTVVTVLAVEMRNVEIHVGKWNKLSVQRRTFQGKRSLSLVLKTANVKECLGILQLGSDSEFLLVITTFNTPTC